MEVWPSFRWLKVFSQVWEGDVTMVLPSTFMQIKKSITNPTIDDLKFASLQVGHAPPRHGQPSSCNPGCWLRAE